MPAKKVVAKKTASTRQAKSAAFEADSFAVGSLRFHKRRVLRVLAVASLALNLVFVVGIAMFFHELNHAATSRYADTFLRQSYNIQSQFCSGHGYDNLLSEAAHQAGPGSDADKARAITSASVCRIDYKTGKPIDDPAMRAVFDQNHM